MAKRRENLDVKTCTYCHIELPVEKFYISSQGYPSARCKECNNKYKEYWRHNLNGAEYERKYNRNAWHKHGERYRVLNKLSKYKISMDEYNLLTNKCSICGSLENLCVDHNHTTGKVRGKLCRNCNSALGLLKEDELILKKMIKYIKLYKND